HNNNDNNNTLKSCIQHITDNMRNNRVKFNLTSSQLEKMRQHDRHQRMRKHIASSSSLSSDHQKILKKYMLLNVNHYHFSDESHIVHSHNNDEYVDDENVVSLYDVIHQLEHTKIGSEHENTVLKHIFSIHL